MTNEEVKAFLAQLFECPEGSITANEIYTFAQFFNGHAARIRSETRATALAEEDRRVWCEKYATERNGGWSDDIATKWADGKLGLYCEARAAWDARGEG